MGRVSAIYLLGLMIFLPWELMSQINTNEVSGLRVFTKPERILIGEYQLGFEHFKPGVAINTCIGYNPSGTGPEKTVQESQYTGYLLSAYQNQLYEGFLTESGVKFYQKELDNFLYVEFLVFYRYWWFFNEHAKFIDTKTPQYSYDGIRSEQNHVIGSKLLVGFTIANYNHKSYALFFDVFGGIGLRHKWFNFKTVNIADSGQIMPPRIESPTQWMPSVHFGCRLGVQSLFKQQDK